ncbi:MAG: DUF4189 domain-containing protein [Defluviicoccus sp.]|nr:DUF4189 domain-containing protein [Defluviicoccus sp.]MDE0277850.1 DUF4189 domain-containing protein [Defluviicoccus sp.]
MAISDPQRNFIAYAAALGAAGLLLIAPPARAQDAHGAIAFGQTGDGQSVAYGFAWNQATRDEAKEAAISACLAGGGTGCVELAWFRNGCGALAVDQHGNAQGKSAMSREQAEARALRICESSGGSGCAVVGSQCAGPGGRAATWSGSESVLAMPEVPRGRTARGTAGRDGPQKAGGARDEALTREERVRIQRGLAALGFDTGPADGMFGPRTRSAIWEWQQAKGLEATGYLTQEESEALAASAGEIRRERASQDASGEARAGNQVLYFAAAGPKCPGMPEGSSCWREMSNKPGCHFWVPDFYPLTKEVDWSGACSGDTAHGRGTLRWSGPSFSGQGTGEMVHGKEQGHWVERWTGGGRAQGPYVDSVRNGHWVWRWPNGAHFEGEIRDGKPNGFGIYTSVDGEKYDGQWRDGCFDDGERRQRIWTSDEACGFE